MSADLYEKTPRRDGAGKTGRAWVLRWRRWLKPFLSRRGSPEAIAGGMAIGFFIAFTPTIGFQIVLAYLVATAFRASRAAALLPIWITTPVTIPPVYTMTYLIGAFFVDGPSVGHVRRQLMATVRRIDRHELHEFPAHFREFLAIGKDIFIPMLLGGAIVGALCAAAAYPATLWSVRRFRAYRLSARQHRRANRQRLRLPFLKEHSPKGETNDDAARGHW